MSDASETEYIVLRPEADLALDDLPGVYVDKLLARAEMVAPGQEYLRFHEADTVFAYPTDEVVEHEGGQAQVWRLTRTPPSPDAIDEPER